ncbi:SDR family NAD(P)-dependent oxidoreductase [Methylobacterium nodulans]|uniref:Short-chain dehydrogenase/reductase SDR n=1 Tax=Methylobacterium nodulans (strain LMG 21967 / CNCM I-2342 / ORS 2060) TaxID=460265 RepID=B8INC3_METNO|nr:SDR family oxidoreductase [Methylobacterium nodulans]ACL56449.1 short-chain dehydrogenase/reductase SDR [Methylobacterium nodulans ORS 2060]
MIVAHDEIPASPGLTQAVILVTGGASGIGRAIVEAALASGARAVAWDVDAAGLAACAEACGDRLRTARVDVSDESAVAGAMAELAGSAWAPTHLVNNAGIIGRRMALAEMDPAEIDRVLAVNLKSVLYCTRAFLSGRAPHPAAAILNLSSIAARTGGMPGNALYATTKGAIASLTVAAAKELAPAIRVNALAPGVIDTPIQGDVFGDRGKVAEIASSIPLRRPGTAAEVAAAALWLLSPAAAYVTGTIVDVAGGR